MLITTMTFTEYISNLYARFSSECSTELSVVPGSLICYLVKTAVNFIKEKAPVFQSSLGLSFVSEKEPAGKVCYLNNPEVRAEFRFTFSSIDLLDFIYAVLHSSSYKERYKEFVRMEFDWIPCPKDVETFWMLAELGGKLRRIHLLESLNAEQPVTRFPVSGNNFVDKIRFEVYDYEQALAGEKESGYFGAVYINDNQYFAEVPVSAWSAYSGEYQPAQKWLNERKNKRLNEDDIVSYQKIIAAMTETWRISEDINKIEIE